MWLNIAMGWSPSQRVLPSAWRIRIFEINSEWDKANCLVRHGRRGVFLMTDNLMNPWTQRHCYGAAQRLSSSGLKLHARRPRSVVADYGRLATSPETWCKRSSKRRPRSAHSRTGMRLFSLLNVANMPPGFWISYVSETHLLISWPRCPCCAYYWISRTVSKLVRVPIGAWMNARGFCMYCSIQLGWPCNWPITYPGSARKYMRNIHICRN
jgi:hypothetical protein